MKGLVREILKDEVVRQLVRVVQQKWIWSQEFYSEIHIAPEQLAALRKWISDHGRSGFKRLKSTEYLEVIWQKHTYG